MKLVLENKYSWIATCTIRTRRYSEGDLAEPGALDLLDLARKTSCELVWHREGSMEVNS